MGKLISKLKKLMKTPRPEDINFPEVQNKLKISIEKSGEKYGDEGKRAKSICALKSGNLLISYLLRDEENGDVKSCLAIYSIPNLKLLEEYIFDNEIDGKSYLVDNAIQLKNGNIFTVCDKFYIFDGESISKGPKTESDEINSVECIRQEFILSDVHDIEKKKTISIFKFTYLCDFLLEVKEGILLCTYYENQEIFLLDIDNLNQKRKSIFSYMKGNNKYHLDIIYQSIYYPEYLYIIANYNTKVQGDNYECILLAFNLDELCEKSKTQKNPLFTVNVSQSVNIYSLCEYDKKYLLLETMKKEIFIIDMEVKQKVAVCTLRILMQGKYFNQQTELNTTDYFSRFSFLTRSMIKLKDGLVMIHDNEISIADIREQTILEKIRLYYSKLVICGKYFVSLYHDTHITAFTIYED